MLSVVGFAACDVPDVEADEWIPLNIVWGRPQGQPLYLRISGEQGGEIELKVDPDTGTLCEFIVLIEPPDVVRAISTTAGEHSGSVPVLDRSLWSWKETPDYREPKDRFATMRADLGRVSADEYVVVLSGRPTSAYATAGSVRVGISEDGYVTEVRALVS